jgi:hypothetical protein
VGVIDCHVEVIHDADGQLLIAGGTSLGNA